MGSKPHCEGTPIRPHESKKLQTKISVPESVGRVGHGRDLITSVRCHHHEHHDTTADVMDDCHVTGNRIKHVSHVSRGEQSQEVSESTIVIPNSKSVIL